MTKASQWPKDFKLDEAKKSYAIKNGVDPKKLTDFWEDFQDWCLGKGAMYKDWDAAFRMRVRKAREWNLFQGRPEPIVKRRPRTDNTLPEALRVLATYGQEKFKNYCLREGLSRDEQEAVWMKHQGKHDIAKLAGGMLRGV
jgi:hypothetical protein